MTSQAASAPGHGLLAPQYFWTTIAANALIFLGAFESLAVTTVMPTISRELNGDALYSVAFSGTLAASVIGMVVAGRWADHVGPSRPLIGAIAVFLVGLLLSGIAADMGMFIVGRFLQGLGAGAINVALYVVVARIYPPTLHPQIFGTFAAAWVLPAMIGPPVAGLVSDTISWHWVFLGVGVLVLISGAAIIPALRLLHAMVHHRSTSPRGRWGVVWAFVVASGVLTISLGGSSGGLVSWLIALAAFAIVVCAVRPLVPRGTFLARPGLPATILLRAVIAAAFFGAEVYLPYLLNAHYGLPSWLSGLILTVGTVSWAIGSAVQGKLGDRMSHNAALRVGTALLMVGTLAQLLTAALVLSPAVAAAGWFVAGGGMGLIFPRISTLVLRFSTMSNQGFNSAALSIADAAAAATAIALAGLLFAAAGGAGAGVGPFVAALSLASLIALTTFPIATRVQRI